MKINKKGKHGAKLVIKKVYLQFQLCESLRFIEGISEKPGAI